MALNLLTASLMAKLAITLTPTVNAMSIIMTIQSDPSAVEIAGKTHRNVFIAYLVWLVVAAVVTVWFTYWLWQAGNRQQDAIVAAMERDNLVLRTDLNTEKGKVAGLEKVAADAQKDLSEQKGKTASLEAAAAEAKTALLVQQGRTAILETAAADAKTTQQRVEIQLAEQQERTAKAERELAEVKRLQEPRRLPVDTFVKALKSKLNPPADIWFGFARVWYVPDVPETYTFALQVKNAMTASGLFGVDEEPSPVPYEPPKLMEGHIPPLIRRGAGPGITLEGGNPISVDALMFALSESGFPARESTVKPTRGGGVLFVVVGPKQ